MRLWLNVWRFEFYLGFHWYYHDKPWYRQLPRLFEVRNFDSSVDMTLYPLFVCLVLSYHKRWNGDDDEPKWFWI